MAIKGLTIEISGKTTKLEAALNRIKGQSKGVESGLKNINNALKFNPRNTELLMQKQILLRQKIDATKERLEAFKVAQKTLDSQGVDKTSKEYMEVRRNIIECESKLKNFNAELKRTEAAISVVGQLGSKFQDTGKKITEAGRKFKYISLGAGLAFGKAAMGTAEFEKSLAKVSTISDDTQVPIKELGKEISKLSNTYGISSTELSEATYQALSASIETKDAAKFVDDAAKLAKTGFLETNEAVDVLTTTINAYGYQAKDAAMISDKLIEVQNRGKTTVKELSDNMGQVIPTAAALGVNLDNLGAAYIVMTKKGINAANATTYTRAMLDELSKGGSKVSQILKEKTGKSFSELMASGKSLGDVLNILYDSTGKNGTEFKNLWGNVRAGSGALALVGGDVQAFNVALAQIKDSSGNVDKALKKLQTTSAGFKKILNALKNIMITVTGALAEKVAPIVSFIADKISALANALTNLQGKHDGVLAALGAILPILAAIAPALLITGTLINKFGAALSAIAAVAPGFSGALGKAFGFLKANPIILVIAALAALILMIHKTGMTAEQLSSKIAGFVQGAVNIVNNIVAQLPTILNAIINGLITMLPALVDGAVTLFSGIVQALPQIIPPLINATVNLINALIEQLPTLIPILIEASVMLFMAIVEAIPIIAKALWDALPLIINALIQGLSNALPMVWDGIKTGMKTAFESIFNVAKTAWEKVKTAIISPVESAWTAVKRVVEKLKGAFKFSWKLPDLKLPHLSVKGGKAPWGLGGKGSLPKFNIAWYKEGGIFDKPTIAGIGEAGSEAVLPTHKLDAFLQNAANRANGNNGEMVQMLAKILNAIEQANKGSVNQEIHFHEPYSSPIDVARALKRQAIELGMAGQI